MMKVIEDVSSVVLGDVIEKMLKNELFQHRQI